MTSEEQIFKRSKINWNKLIEYGFKKENDNYKYSKEIMNNDFRVDINIDSKGIVLGKVYDLTSQEEYTAFKVKDSSGAFTLKVKEQFEEILKDIKSKCFEIEPFIFDQSNRIAKRIKEKYGNEPEFEWEKFPGYAIFRNTITRKWYGAIMDIEGKKIDSSFNDKVEILDVKLDPDKISELLNKTGYYLAYHMNKKNWITIVLDDTIDDDMIMSLIDESYGYTLKK